MYCLASEEIVVAEGLSLVVGHQLEQELEES